MRLRDPRPDPSADRLDRWEELPGRLDRAEVWADLRAAWRTVLILVVAGLPLGALWTVLAPARRLVTLPEGASGSLTGDSEHVFDALAVFVLMLLAFGVVAGAVAWRRRRRRGPVVLAATVVGTLAGAWVASRVGVLLAHGGAAVPVAVDPARASGGAVDGPPLSAVLTSLPPSPGPWWVVLAAGFAAALTYLFAAIVNGLEDMDRVEE